MGMKPLPKILISMIGVGTVFFGIKEAAYRGYIPRPDALKSVIPIKADLIEAQVLETDKNVKITSLPSRSPVTNSIPEMRIAVWAWNAQMGLMYANGGELTTQNSLMDKQKVKLRIVRQDDPSKMQDMLMATAQSLSENRSMPSDSAQFVAIMGDGAAPFLASLNGRLSRLGSEYEAEVIDIIGYSRNEDKFMGPVEWKNDPQKARGGVGVAVLRDGDWNLAMRWLEQNGIPNNPDEKTYDPEAFNWISVNSYIEASEKYISNYCEERPIKGKPSEKKKVCAQAPATWTPGDVMIAEKKGGIVTLMSTKSAIFQMPCTIIGIKKYNSNNADRIAGFIAAASDGADQIRNSQEAFKRAAEVSTAVYKEQNPEYWMKYFHGVTKKDLQGHEIELGGSSVANLADAEQAFGIRGGVNIFQSTYETFGNIAKQQYPNILPTFPPASTILNTRYVLMAKNKLNDTDVKVEKINYSSSVSEVVARRNYSINYGVGSAVILASSFETLKQITSDMVTSNNTMIIHGHTDNTGTPDGNIALSQKRADAVKAFIMTKGGDRVPSSRILTVAHGQEEPIESNTTEVGRSKNRRVEIILGN